MATRGPGWASAAGILLALALALPPQRSAAGEPDRRPPPDAAVVQAAEAEKSPATPEPSGVDLPVFIYHHVVPGRASGSRVTRTLFVTPDDFEQQLKYLKDNDYRTISFDDLADCLEYGVPAPEHAAIITFDDGWANQFAYAFPLLQKYDFTATFFIVTDYLDHPNFMTTDQLKVLIAAGMTIGSHSRSHPALATIGNPRRLEDEISGSKAWLEERLGVPVDSFAYPYGSYTAAVVAVVKAAGYRTARTVNSGTHHTAGDLATLDAVLFPAYLDRVRNKVEFAAHETQRQAITPR